MRIPHRTWGPPEEVGTTQVVETPPQKARGPATGCEDPIGDGDTPREAGTPNRRQGPDTTGGRDPPQEAGTSPQEMRGENPPEEAEAPP